ncbi:MAG: peptide chain release factor 1 [Myxococcales bacterium]|nr:peptide chain release factor 1 [Myxococcales bacterium]
MTELSQRLAELEHRSAEVNEMLANPSVLGDPKRMAEIGREHRDLQAKLTLARSLTKTLQEIEDTRGLIQDAESEEMRELIQEELEELEQQRESLKEEFEELLLPRDPLDDKNIILEIRAGAGGNEASLFAGDLLRMYLRFAEGQNWKTQILSSSPSELGGFKEVIAEIKGSQVYSNLKYESGVHRVQRIPVTERQGRIHTSTVTVAVLPEAEEVDVEVHDKDLRIDVYRSSGAGGQHVNTTDSAVRITHLPSNIVVSCQDERSQIQNRARAMQILRARLLVHAQEEVAEARAAERKTQVGTGDRSERIRTYNFPQNRVTDHRIGLTLRSLDSIIEGDLSEVFDGLKQEERNRRLTETEEEG